MKCYKTNIGIFVSSWAYSAGWEIFHYLTCTSSPNRGAFAYFLHEMSNSHPLPGLPPGGITLIGALGLFRGCSYEPG